MNDDKDNIEMCCNSLVHVVFGPFDGIRILSPNSSDSGGGGTHGFNLVFWDNSAILSEIIKNFNAGVFAQAQNQ